MRCNMTRQDLKMLGSLLDKYYEEQSKTCDYNCCNCDLGILEGHGYGHSCAIEVITRKIAEELYS